MISQINARQLGNDAIYVDYWEDGKAKNAAFVGWQEFFDWLREKIETKK